MTRTVTLNSGKKASIVGKGPPILFSSGIFNMVSTRFYSNIINKLKKEVSIISITDFSPLKPEDIDDVAESIGSQQIGFFSHSSFDTKILTSSRIHKAVLCDPICIPDIDFNGFSTRIEYVDYPVIIMKAQYLYDSEITIPTYQTPVINGKDVKTIQYSNVGHADLLDNFWANVAKRTNFWVAASKESVPFDEWSYDSIKNTKVNLDNYRSNVSNDALNFLLDRHEVIT